MSKFKPIYTTVDNVKVRLANKVQFQSGKNAEDGELPDLLLNQLIVDSETEVEQDLRARYAVPFQSKRTGDYRDLPDHSKRAIRMAVDMKCVIMVIETDFGRGTHVSADGYLKNLHEHYDKYLLRLLGQDEEGKNSKIDRFRRTPPLDDLKLSATNKESDDGYHGMIINTDQNERDAVSYAGQQINNPAASYVSRRRTGVIK